MVEEKTFDTHHSSKYFFKTKKMLTLTTPKWQLLEYVWPLVPHRGAQILPQRRRQFGTRDIESRESRGGKNVDVDIILSSTIKKIKMKG